MIRGYVKKGKRTKEIAKCLGAGEIPVIDHMDIDETAAGSLIEARVKAVINCSESISGRYPANGAKMLVQYGIKVLDDLGEMFYGTLQDGDLIEIKNGVLSINQRKYCGSYRILTEKSIDEIIENSGRYYDELLDKFIDNTLEYAQKEKEYVLKPVHLPELAADFKDRHALIVIRGANYKQDLKAIRDYIRDFRPILIGVDGGGDALMEFGLIPDMVIGDMDSVSDLCLKKCGEIVVHAYPDGNAPGAKRVSGLGLEAKIFPFPGTSEDVALLIAFEKKAELIVAVGTHTGMIDFLEKGRNGMASTMLTRLKVGAKLIDARGVSKLYSNRLKLKYCVPVFASLLIPLLAIISIYIPFRIMFNILRVRLGLH